eukprot:g11891.t1
MVAEGQVLASPMAEGYKAAVVPGGPGVQLVTSEDGDVLAVHMSQTAQLYTTVDRILNSQRSLDFVLQGQRPSEWAVGEQPKGTLILMPEQEQEGDLLTETGKVVSDATKFVGGAAFGGVGLVTDTLGITKNAEEHLATGAEEGQLA